MPVFNTVNLIDYGLIGLYFAILIWVGVFAARKNTNTDEFFRGGEKVPWVMAGMSNWVAGFSAFMFVAASGYAYTRGAGTLLIFTSATWAYLVGYWYFAARWRRARIKSPLQFLTRRYSHSTTYYYSITSILPQIVGIGQGLYILCIFIATALGFSERTFVLMGFSLTGLQISILIVGAVMVIYTAIGGLWAAVLSDTVQSIIIATMTLIVFYVSFSYLGRGNGFGAGFVRLFTDAPGGFFRLTGELASPFFLISYLINALLGYNVAWGLVQRYNSVPGERDARKMALLCAFLSLVGPLLWILPVLGARIIFPDINKLWPSLAVPSEASFVSLALMLLPHGMIGFVVSAILSATLGHANDTFNWLSATLTRDIYVPLKKRFGGITPTERSQLVVARTTMFTVGILGTLVALYIPRFGGAFRFALEFYSLTAAFMMPVALGMMYTRTPWWSGMASCTGAIVVALTLMAMGVWQEDSFSRNMLSESIAATVIFFGSAFWFREDDPRNREVLQFEKDLATPIPTEKARFDPSGFRVYGLLGQICIVLGIVLTLCLAVPSTVTAPAIINVVAGVGLVALGIGLLRLSRSA